SPWWNWCRAPRRRRPSCSTTPAAAPTPSRPGGCSRRATASWPSICFTSARPRCSRRTFCSPCSSPAWATGRSASRRASSPPSPARARSSLPTPARGRRRSWRGSNAGTPCSAATSTRWPLPLTRSDPFALPLLVRPAQLLEVAAGHVAGRARQPLPVDRLGRLLGCPADLLRHLGRLARPLEALAGDVVHDLQLPLVQLRPRPLLL